MGFAHGLAAITLTGLLAAQSGGDDPSITVPTDTFLVDTAPTRTADLSLFAGDVVLNTATTATLTAGDEVWVNLSWTASTDVEDFQVTALATGNLLSVGYPENTGLFTSLYRDAELDAGETDFTALRLRTGAESTDRIRMAVTATWRRAGRLVPSVGTAIVTIPLVAHTGDDLVANTSRVLLGDDGWIELGYEGLAPRIENVRVSVGDEAGLDVVYPRDGTFSQLLNDDDLDRGEVDVTRLRIDPSTPPGRYEVEVTVEYTFGGEDRQIQHVVRLYVLADSLTRELDVNPITPVDVAS